MLDGSGSTGVQGGVRMRRIVLALLVAVVGSARFASGAAISVAGAECGTPPLGTLSFTTQTGSNLSIVTTENGTLACPDVPTGGSLGDFGFGSLLSDTTGAPLYGTSLTSLDLTISGVTDVSLLDPASFPNVPFAFTNIQFLGGNTFRLSGGPGIQISCFTSDILTDGQRCTPDDALILFNGFATGTTFTVAAVNPVPEPATSALLLSGLGAALVRRVRRRRT